MNNTNINLRGATVEEDSLIAEHFYQLWLDNQIPVEAIASDWLDITLQFIKFARQGLSYQAFVAESANQIIGSASCQLFAGLYPPILLETHRKYGYIWGVYVIPPYRRQGIGKKLTQLTVNYLRSHHCTRAILNASPSGKPVYASMGFVTHNAMELDL